MKENLDVASDHNKTRRNVNDILGAVTFNITELSRLQDLYRLAEDSGMLNISDVEMDNLSNKLQQALQDVSKLPHYLITVWELLGDEQFQEFFLFHQSALLCANSDEKTKSLFQVINAFRSLCNTNKHMNKVETRFYAKAYRQWRAVQPHIPIVKAVQYAWEAEAGDGPNNNVLSPLDVPEDALVHCQLDDIRLTKLVVQCLWTDFCMPYVVYKCRPEYLRLGDLRTLRPTAWLNDVIISTYTILLRSKSKDCVLVPRSFVMGDHKTPFVYDAVSEARCIKKARKVVGDQTIKKILIPRNYSNFHWSLVAMELSSEDENEVVISHYDSAYNRKIDAPEEIRRLLAFAKEFLLTENSATLDKDNIKFRSIVPDRVPKQHNDYDCGVFVCIMAATLSGALHTPFSDIDQAFITDKNCRASICASILTDELVPPAHHGHSI
eukprot:CAMPEP_0176476812 /NCGR_PEP_ID=MMETSP0200_2-20121128/264_1 /TAXON_ID=947934 /ORGANISM="Chaetoceros sp., Strain GSL56" /LENGTH=437 /DNA_ID=CAMNT_0017872531 /DNA_START=83 /DNA_END=1396 /DNA_ORIENTATION=+